MNDTSKTHHQLETARPAALDLDDIVCDKRARPTPLNLDDIVAVSQIVTALTGRPLSPFESSRLKSAYNKAHTLTDLAAELAS